MGLSVRYCVQTHLTIARSKLRFRPKKHLA